MKNDDNECFKWCITRALNPIDKNQGRITKELVEQSKNFAGVVLNLLLLQTKIFIIDLKEIITLVLTYLDMKLTYIHYICQSIKVLRLWICCLFQMGLRNIIVG